MQAPIFNLISAFCIAYASELLNLDKLLTFLIIVHYLFILSPLLGLIAKEDYIHTGIKYKSWFLITSPKEQLIVNIGFSLYIYFQTIPEHKLHLLLVSLIVTSLSLLYYVSAYYEQLEHGYYGYALASVISISVFLFSHFKGGINEYTTSNEYFFIYQLIIAALVIFFYKGKPKCKS